MAGTHPTAAIGAVISGVCLSYIMFNAPLGIIVLAFIGMIAAMASGVIIGAQEE